MPLAIHGGGSKAFYGRQVSGTALNVRNHCGIVNYEPTELVLTARAGTPLAEINEALADKGQMLPFEPPDFDGVATLGGAISTGLSGPRRPWAGSARDLVLGTRLINGQGEHNRYGGEVMKNVAGYDVSRVVTGALGTLGVITEISMKVLPQPESEHTLVIETTPGEAASAVEGWFRQGHPVSGAALLNGRLHLRLSGAASAVEAGRRGIGGETLEGADQWWRDLRDQRLSFFADEGPPLWRISLPPGADGLALEGEQLLDWNGQLRWLRTAVEPAQVFASATELGGHATLFRGGERNGDVFQPLPEALHRLNKRLKTALDPAGIFNPGRMYADI